MQYEIALITPRASLRGSYLIHLLYAQFELVVLAFLVGMSLILDSFISTDTHAAYGTKYGKGRW